MELIGKVAYLPQGGKTLTEDDIKSLKAKSSVFEQDGESDSSEDEREGFSVDFRKNRVERKRRDSFE